MTYAIVAVVVLFLAVLIGLLIYFEHVDRKHDQAEEARFRAMSAEERKEALSRAQQAQTRAFEYRDRVYRLWKSYKWGYRHNPYFARYTVAKMDYARARARVQKFRSIIAELDG